MLSFFFRQAQKFKDQFDTARKKRRWRKLREIGMHIGKGVNLPMSTWIDTSHCFLITIEDNCGFGDECLILAHDAMPNEYIDASVVGKVIIHESCHFGARTVILPGVEIGPRAIIGAGSVVSQNIPPDSVAAGNPARVLCTIDEYLERHKTAMKDAPIFSFKEYDLNYITPKGKALMIQQLGGKKGYIVGGYTAMVQNGECLVRTD